MTNKMLILNRSNRNCRKDPSIPLDEFCYADPEPLIAFQKNDDQTAAVCTILRAGAVRKEKYYFSTGAKTGWCS